MNQDNIQERESFYNEDNKQKNVSTCEIRRNYSPENNFYENEVFLPRLNGEINEKDSKESEGFSYMGLDTENSALKQLMSPDVYLNKQQRTVLFDHDNGSRMTIEKIAVDDPLVECIPEAVTIFKASFESEKNSTRKKYHCNKCERIFDQLSTFKKHVVKHKRTANGDIQYTCTQCGKKIAKREKFKKHCLGHGDPELECDKCYKVFASKFTLRTHRKIHTRKYRCGNCKKRFSKLLDLKAHATNCHSVTSEDNDWKDANVNDADEIISKALSNKIFLLNSKMARIQTTNKNCDICSKTFSRIGDLKRHLVKHVVTSTLSKNPVDKNGSLSIRCQVCLVKVFNDTDEFKEHLREHAKLALYRCTYCNKSFSDSSNFSKHKKKHALKHFQCDICQTKFNSWNMIIRHMDVHNNNLPLDCSYCDRNFYFKSMLNNHIKNAHAMEVYNRFRCNFCHGHYGTQKEKSDHEWLVHKVRKTIDCGMCDSKFKKYSELKKHYSLWHDIDIPTAKNFST
ncbi:zinc finger protein 431-like [Battus philenor]|uniref:zinc finger protein 431-like n=1 Tax=Battus philenor TaxID=42288 RepID=UPI0035CF1B16